MVKAVLMGAVAPGHAMGQGVATLLEQLDRHYLAPDGSLATKSAYLDLVQAREEMARERLRYLEGVAVYSEAVALVEEYQQAQSVASMGGVRDLMSVFAQLDLRSTPQTYDALEQRLAVSEAIQRLRLPLLSKDGDVPDDDTAEWGNVSRSSFDSITTSISLSTTTTVHTTTASTASATVASGSGTQAEVVEPGVGGVANRFLGISPAWLRQTHLSRSVLADDNTGYQTTLIPEIEGRLRSKCDKLAAAFEPNEAVMMTTGVRSADAAGPHPSNSLQLPERVKLAVEDVEVEEAALLVDLYAADRKFSEYYNVLEQILGILLRLIKEFKLQHQHEYDGMRKEWLCKRCQTMSTKLRVLEHLLLRDTYTQESLPALQKIRGYVMEANEEATAAYNRAVTRLREYQGVDQYFDDIARRYHDLVMKLEGIQWTIQQVEMDLESAHEHTSR
ncbi:hypothetical protein CY35_17G060900 [Sphagnum magellanicum]|nr:hypothetical protein CY35_17G060900 [Sphagnum magellanicum]KAH9535576.1 hypothetical protein CY35_17G060900 [Sphagnum magellanicum]